MAAENAILLLVVLLTLAAHDHHQVLAGVKLQTEESKLRKQWPENYDKDIRPAINASRPVRVIFGVAIGQIVEVNTKKETVALNLFLRQWWKDDFLAWNPSDFRGLNDTNISPDQVWLPDIVLQNNAGGESKLRGNLKELTKKVTVSSDGSAKWFTVVVLKSICPMDVKFFPFDEQTCTFKFGSWTHNQHQLDIFPENPDADLGNFARHSEWEMVSAKQLRTTEYPRHCTNPFSVITLEIRIRRRPLFHVIHLIIPMVLVALLSLLSFSIPSKSGERISYGVTLLLTITLFMWLLAEKIPAASDSMSKVGIFFNTLTVVMVAMVFGMSFVAGMHHKRVGDKSIPEWLRVYVFDFLAYKLGIRNRGNRDKNKRTDFGNCKEKPSFSSVESTSDGSLKSVLCKKTVLAENRNINTASSNNDIELPEIKVVSTKVETSLTSEQNNDGKVDVDKNHERSFVNDNISNIGKDCESATSTTTMSPAVIASNGDVNIQMTSSPSPTSQKETLVMTENVDDVDKKVEETSDVAKPIPRLRNVGLHLIMNKRKNSNNNNNLLTDQSNAQNIPLSTLAPSSTSPTAKMSFQMVAECAMESLAKRKNELMEQKLAKERREKLFFYEWRVCADTVDRLFSIIFVGVFVVAAIWIFHGF